jgi:peptide/nickel transport system ATP-binding protein
VTDVALLEARDLRITFVSRSGKQTRAVDGIDLTIEAGDTTALVGESGSGKSVTMHAILGLLPGRGVRLEGSIRYDGQELVGAPESVLRRVRGHGIATVFQDPLSSLNPLLTVGRHLTDVIQRDGGVSKRDARRQALAMLELLEIPDAPRRLDVYPHQLSGGLRQRVVIAMALACQPRLLIADEPTTALDVTVQAQVLSRLRELVADTGTALLLITHNLAIVSSMCRRVNVMYSGRIVESGTCQELFADPRHHYTRGLLDSVPDILAPRNEPLHPIPGSPRDALSWTSACAFAPRCGHEIAPCLSTPPQLSALPGGAGHAVRCHNPRAARQEAGMS